MVSWQIFLRRKNRQRKHRNTRIGLASFTAEIVEAFHSVLWSRGGQYAWILNNCESRSLYLFCVREINDFAIRTVCGTVLKCNQFSMCRESQNNFLTAALEKRHSFFPKLFVPLTYNFAISEVWWKLSHLYSPICSVNQPFFLLLTQGFTQQ